MLNFFSSAKQIFQPPSGHVLTPYFLTFLAVLFIIILTISLLAWYLTLDWQPNLSNERTEEKDKTRRKCRKKSGDIRLVDLSNDIHQQIRRPARSNKINTNSSFNEIQLKYQEERRDSLLDPAILIMVENMKMQQIELQKLRKQRKNMKHVVSQFQPRKRKISFQGVNDQKRTVSSESSVFDEKIVQSGPLNSNLDHKSYQPTNRDRKRFFTDTITNLNMTELGLANTSIDYLRLKYLTENQEFVIENEERNIQKQRLSLPNKLQKKENHSERMIRKLQYQIEEDMKVQNLMTGQGLSADNSGDGSDDGDELYGNDYDPRKEGGNDADNDDDDDDEDDDDDGDDNDFDDNDNENANDNGLDDLEFDNMANDFSDNDDGGGGSGSDGSKMGNNDNNNEADEMEEALMNELDLDFDDDFLTGEDGDSDIFLLKNDNTNQPNDNDDNHYDLSQMFSEDDILPILLRDENVDACV